jgi:CelD/BcsL family acetyltransferase involved in cellulose biosynthesis
MPAPADPAAQTRPFRLHAGEAALARLAQGPAALTPFQSVGLLEPLIRRTDQLDAFRVIEITLPDAELLLPLTMHRRGPFRVADICGGKQASYHAGVPGENAAITPEALYDTLRAAGRAMGLDAFTFTDCPIRYGGRDNPLALLPHQASPSSGWSLRLEGEADALLARLSDRDDRKKLRQKANKLAALGAVQAGWAETPDARAEAFEALFRWKAARFGAAGIDDPFAQAGMRECLAEAGESGALRLFTLAAGPRLVAVLAGAGNAGCFSGMLNGHEGENEIARTSPGEQLIVHLIHALCAEGFRHFDLGVGEARYKAHYCPEEIALVDCAVAVNANGEIAARLFLALRGMKRAIKQNPRLMALASRLRQMRQASRN